MTKRIKSKQGRAKTTRLTPGAKLLRAVTPYLHLDDQGGVEIALATVVANTIDGESLWVLIVNPSSSAKTELVQMFAQVDICEWLAELTENTLLSGFRDDSSPSRRNSLLHRLTDPALRDGRPPIRIFLIQDFTGLITSRRERRDAIFGQLRQVYDGRLVKSTGMGEDLLWEGYLGLLGAVTPIYDEVAELNSTLGERFVLYRPARFDIEEEARQAVGRNGMGWRDKIAKLAITCVEEGKELIKIVKIPPKARERLIDLAQFIAIARTAVPREGYQKVVKSIPQPEGPSRLVQQLKKLLQGLVAVRGRITPTEKEFLLLAKVARDTIPKIRLTIIEALAEGEKTKSDLVEYTDLPQPTIHYLLEDLKMLKVVAKEGKGWKLSNDFQSRCDRARIFPSVSSPSQSKFESDSAA